VAAASTAPCVCPHFRARGGQEGAGTALATGGGARAGGFAGAPTDQTEEDPMSMVKRALLAALFTVPAACGIGGDGDVTTSRQSAVVTCTNPTNGMVITTNTTLCAGNFSMATTAGNAAVTVGANNVQVTCNGTRLVGPGPVGPGPSPNVAFKIAGRSGVTLLGCSANAFQYGALVQNSSNVTLDSTHFDDNYNDPNQGWVQDGVQGGGVRLDNVTASTVKNSSFERNWNGIELRGGSGNTVNNDVADHCSNWGALLVASNNNTVSNSDFSWTYRGGLSYPNNWWKVDTRDSAAIVVDAGSTGNLIQNNNAQYSGDGIFIRAVIGNCAEANTVIGNNTSYSPHNGIESWCDRGVFKNNTASFCDYGLWLGASDAVTVTGNTANSNKTDGISTQNGEDRHSLIQDNTLNSNARAGLFLAGSNYQDSVPPTSDGQVWNSSHLLVQRNTFASNALYDVYLGYSRDVVLASNNATPAKVVFESGTTAYISTIGSYSGAAGRTPPIARLATPGPVTMGVATQFDASASTLGPQGGTLAFTWLIQPAGARFPNGLPTAVFGGSGPNKKTVTFTAPGFYDVDVTATDGSMGSLASVSIPVAPGGLRVGQTASAWAASCDPSDTGCLTATTFSDDPAGLEGTAVHMATNAAFNMGMYTPVAKNLALNASGYSKLGFFIKASDPHTWQTGSPHAQLPGIILGSPSGTITYEPANATLLPNTADGWVFIEVPLAAPAGSGWNRAVAGGSLSQVNWVQIDADTWDSGFDIWVDAVSFYN
jgi:parallel beta-helix repeat protein